MSANPTALPCNICDFNSQDISSAIQEQNSQFSSEIVQAIAITNPFANILPGGTVPNNQGRYILNIVQGNAVPANSLVAPVYVNDTDVCLTTGNEMNVGATTHSVQLQTYRGTGPAVCMKGTRIDVENSLLAAMDSMKKSISQELAVDIRYQMFIQSGLKCTVASGYPLGSMFNGGLDQTGVFFPMIGLPDGAPSFKTLTRFDTYLRENFLCEPWESGEDAYCVIITGKELNDRIFFEQQMQNFVLSRVKGGFMEGIDEIESYAFTQVRQKGILFGIDQQPMRFNAMTDDPLPIFIPPMVAVNADTGGQKMIPNTTWLNATFEVGFIIYRNTFKRIVPEKYVGEGTWKFVPQLHFGEFMWYIPPGINNAWGDVGFHLFQITRAYQPIRPQQVIPFIFKRCITDLDLLPCTPGLSI